MPIKQNVINRFLTKSNKNIQERRNFKREKGRMSNFYGYLKEIEKEQQRFI